jgi:acyl-CoA reductase-like NAD-dependent aldehyde dehydrogenase
MGTMDLKAFAAQIAARSFPLAWPGQYIDGAWVAPRRGSLLKPSLNPNDGTKLIEVGPDKDAVNAALEAAFRAKKHIAETPIAERMEWLHRFRQLLSDYETAAVDLMRYEAGKPRWEAQADFDSALRYLEWVATKGEEVFDQLLQPARLGQDNATFKMLPIGVTAAYLPFSTPLTSFVFYFGATMLAGCPLILNSSSHALLPSLLYALTAQELDLPKSWLNVVFGNFNSFKQMFCDKRISAVLYTGSREHCDVIRLESRAHLGRQVVLQSGGKNAVIVHSSADLDHAVKCVVYGALKTAGQRCTSTSRVFVYRSLMQDFNARLYAAFNKVSIGRTDLDEPGDGPLVGPLYSDKAVEKFLRFQTMANRESEKTLLWGKAIETLPKGNFVSPSLHYVTKFDDSSAYQGNVLFSPDVAIYDYDVLDTAIEQINTTDAAFAVSFIGDPDVLEARRHLFLAPNLLVNQPTAEMETTLPLAGRLQSGHHRYHGPGIALYLCYPQVLAHGGTAEAQIRDWPWPKF